MIIKQIVMPLKTSRARNRCFGAAVIVGNLNIDWRLQVRKLKAMPEERIMISSQKFSF
jgi:hypothetical protein